MGLNPCPIDPLCSASMKFATLVGHKEGRILWIRKSLIAIIMNHRGLNSSGGLRVEKNIMPVANGFVWNVEGRNSFIVVVKRSTSQDHGNLLVV